MHELLCEHAENTTGELHAITCVMTPLEERSHHHGGVELHQLDVRRFHDIGVAGLERLLRVVPELAGVGCIVAVAGMDGALPTVLAGLVSCPVLAVPTSIGYGAAFDGIAPLLTMLNSCAPGVAVLNIDNGYGAAVTAHRVLRSGTESSS